MAVVYDVVERAVEKLWLVSLLWMLIDSARCQAFKETVLNSNRKKWKKEKVWIWIITDAN
jgi:hypothetical protein